MRRFSVVFCYTLLFHKEQDDRDYGTSHASLLFHTHTHTHTLLT